MKEYDFPLNPLVDTMNRISSWQGNTNDDPYLWQQVRYFEELVKQGYVTKRKQKLKSVQAQRLQKDVKSQVVILLMSYTKQNLLEKVGGIFLSVILYRSNLAVLLPKTRLSFKYTVTVTNKFWKE